MLNNKFAEIIKVYTENNYFTKVKIKNLMANDYEERIWLQIREYREKYKTVLTLKNSNNSNMFINITPSIVSKEINLHKDMTQLGLKAFMYDRISEKLVGNTLEEIKNTFILEEVTQICFGYGFKIESEILIDIAKDKYKANDDDHHFAAVLYESLYSLENSPKFSTTFLIEKNKSFYRKKIVDNYLRNKNINIKNTFEPMTVYVKDKNYVGFDCYELKQRLNDLDVFLTSYNETNTFIKAIISYYYIKYGRFFEKYNEATAIIAFYTIIANEYPEYLWNIKFGILLVENFEIVLNSFTDSEQNGSDITYLVHTLLNLIHQYTLNSISSFDKYISSIRKNNNHKPQNEISQTMIAKKMIHSNPRINKKQALFYLNHKNPNEYYEIKDFLNFCQTSYETSRYSLDNLVKEGYYEKTRIGKKFVYKVQNDNKI